MTFHPFEFIAQEKVYFVMFVILVNEFCVNFNKVVFYWMAQMKGLA